MVKPTPDLIVARGVRRATTGASVMASTRPYVDDLQRMVAAAVNNDLAPQQKHQLAAELDGRFGTYLLRKVSRKDRRAVGAFFTGQSAAMSLTAPLAKAMGRDTHVFDPACGSGDLLLAAARHLPVASTLRGTLQLWSTIVSGRDLHEELVDVAKARLTLLAVHRCGRPDKALNDLSEYFGGIQPGNGLTATKCWKTADIVLMNPPFHLTVLPQETDWGSGRATQAAEFVTAFLNLTEGEARVAAILPDAIRSGPRYRHLREAIDKRSTVTRIHLHGRLPAADIDVFMLHARKPGPGRHTAWSAAPTSKSTVRDRFRVSVGAVVPHRDPTLGPSVPYIHARVLPSLGDFEASEERRRFGGTTVMPPFVVVRRTSAPGQHRRVTPTLITGKEPVAVENHLIVLSPIDGKLLTCRDLIELLNRSSTADWMNARIRCRHLTVEAIGELPWGEN